MKTPENCVVSVEAPAFCTPRIDMHMCSASSITATPRGHEARLERIGDLRRHRLLRLQPTREDVDEPGELGKADHAAGRVVGDVRLAEERHHVVLAMRVERDVAHEDDVAVAFDLLEDVVKSSAGSSS